jgi:hypothetical protein
MPFVGIGVGIGRQRFASGIFAAYAARVAADGGVTEAGACVNAVSGISLNSSLLLVPSGYKEDVVYSQIPTDGDGDLTFTRASSATRVNSDGLVEIPRTNLVLYSEQFDNAAWGKLGSTISANVTNSPDGTNSADRIAGDGAYDSVSFFQTITTTSGQNTFSCFLKSDTVDYAYFLLSAFSGISGTLNAYFDLLNGTTPTSAATIEDYGNGWYRCSITANINAGDTTGNFIIRAVPSTSVAQFPTATDAIGKSIFAWGAQVEQGSTATEYIPTTTSARTTFAGITQDGTSASNVPRLDYSQGSCPALLLEPQRTNTILRSQDLSNASWTKTNVTITQNAITSPIESFNSDAIVENSGTNTVFGFHAASRPSGLTIGTTYSVSFFAKKITRDWCYFDDFNAFQTPRVLVFFNLANGTVGTSLSGVLNPKMENYGNGWYRCSFQFVASTTLIDYRIASATSDNTVSYLGTIGQESISVTACQFEVGAYTTSYIPTTSATVTRLADVCSKTGISSLIGQTEGTLFLYADIQKDNNGDFYIAISDGSVLGDAIYLQQPSSGHLQVLIRNSGNVDASITILSANWTAGFNKVAIAYTATTAEVFINGVTKGTTSFVSAPTCSKFTLAARPDIAGQLVGSGGYKQALLFPTRLTNAELAELTTL